MALHEEKLQQVILYFLERINNVHLGRTKLMKLLYYVDFDHYERHGAPLTGAKYRKLPHGPVPDDADKAIGKMVRRGDIMEVTAARGKFAQKRLLTRTARFDAAKLNGRELETLERVAAEWADASAAEISAASHAEAPWAASDAGKAIDYELAHYRRPLGEEPIDAELAKSKTFAGYLAALN
jgi:uncharacterized phage-associated protein